MKSGALVGVVIGVVLGASLLAGDDTRDKASKKDLDTFAGKWKNTSVERDGKKAPVEDDVFVTHEGDKVTVRQGGKVIVQGTIKLDPTKKPKTLDFTSSAAVNKGQSFLGIYQFEGDSYRLCLAGPGEKRPTEFFSKLGTLIVYTRSK